MSVLSHLQSVATAAVLSGDETKSITTSIATIGSRLDAYFGDQISRHVRFGSSTRGTILPRKMDDHSDIDYMVVFASNDAKPQTYLDRLKRFAEKYYSSSETKQSHPSVVLELNHIKFDLVPATSSFLGLQIPNKADGWQSTDPVQFSTDLELANKNNGSLLKPAIRLIKYWNAKRGYVYDSFALEKWIAALGFWGCSNVRDYTFHIVDQFNSWTGAQWQRDEVARAQKIIADTRALERDGFPALAEKEVKKLIPET